jgi:hypothetical protein
MPCGRRAGRCQVTARLDLDRVAARAATASVGHLGEPMLHFGYTPDQIAQQLDVSLDDATPPEDPWLGVAAR